MVSRLFSRSNNPYEDFKEVQAEMQSLINKIFYEKICGICEKDGSDVYWYNWKSNYAHLGCFNRIKKPAQNLINRINRISKDTATRNAIHAVAIRQIRKACEPLTIRNYLDRYGIQVLQAHFDSVNVKSLIDHITPRSRL